MARAKKGAKNAYDQGRRYFQGDGVDCSYEKAAVFLKKAADLGHAKAQYNFGICLHQGLGVKQSFEEAFHYFNLAAEQGNPLANYMLGCFFIFGFIFPPSKEHAAHYFRLAADAGIADAQHNLAMILLSKNDIFKSEAIRYLKLAAKQEHADSLYNLGICYFRGIVVAASRDKAIYYLEIAVKKKQPKAAEALELVFMTPEKKIIFPEILFIETEKKIQMLKFSQDTKINFK